MWCERDSAGSSQPAAVRRKNILQVSIGAAIPLVVEACTGKVVSTLNDDLRESLGMTAREIESGVAKILSQLYRYREISVGFRHGSTHTRMHIQPCGKPPRK